MSVAHVPEYMFHTQTHVQVVWVVRVPRILPELPKLISDNQNCYLNLRSGTSGSGNLGTDNGYRVFCLGLYLWTISQHRSWNRYHNDMQNINMEIVRSIQEHTSVLILRIHRETPRLFSVIGATFSKKEHCRSMCKLRVFAGHQKVDMGVMINQRILLMFDHR